jgi:fructokinase
VKDLTAIGDINIDFTPIACPDELSLRFQTNVGGTVANCAVAACQLGVDTMFVGKVGTDFMAHQARETLRAKGVDTRALLTDPEHSTSHVFVTLVNGERSFTFAMLGSATMNLHPAELDIDQVLDTRMLHVSGSNFVDDAICETSRMLIKNANSRGIPVVLDVNYRAPLFASLESFRDAIDVLIPSVSVFKGSTCEFDDLFGTHDLQVLGSRLAARGVRLVVMTEDAQGVSSWYRDKIQRSAAFEAKVVDTTGAGDCLMGALIYGILKNGGVDALTQESLGEVLTLGNAAAAICIEGYGAVDSMPTLDQATRRTHQPRNRLAVAAS